jgi:hypothetical protein
MGGRDQNKKERKEKIESLMFSDFCEVWRRGTNASKKYFTLIFRSEVMKARF